MSGCMNVWLYNVLKDLMQYTQLLQDYNAATPEAEQLLHAARPWQKEVLDNIIT